MKVVYWLLSIVPAVGSLTIINHVEPYVFGLPFLIFWSAIWLVITSLCLYVSSVMKDKWEGGE